MTKVHQRAAARRDLAERFVYLAENARLNIAERFLTNAEPLDLAGGVYACHNPASTILRTRAPRLAWGTRKRCNARSKASRLAVSA